MRRKKLEISVKDTGIGISKEDQRKLFKLFGDVDSSSNTHGIGLGLYMAKILVAQFGGEIDVTSNVNEGADFYYTISLEEENPKEMQKN
eukprot:CAMPEP_0170510702 /NCGR_PEP_ID=MMETSP0208-20121228/65908_1 /TAXON_ID=197538 /ORGANISM="Strombidium inclinatum, Strain S3" /LENGTH=88 /DNA_ID=CAMNT_0010794187 /DNA_START=1896 /DNA_END=2162 /DNA_ORIENTATION=+